MSVPLSDTRLTERVFVSAGGRRYHATRSCHGLVFGQELNDWDCVEYCTHQHASPRPIGEMPLDEAALLWEPCRRCKPGLPASPTFGHTSWSLEHAEVCARCNASWPCATARVLGIATEGAGQ